MKSRFFAVLFATLIIGCGTSANLTETRLFEHKATFAIQTTPTVTSLINMTSPQYQYCMLEMEKSGESSAIVGCVGGGNYFNAHLRMPFRSIKEVSEELLRREILNDMKREAKRQLIENIFSIDRMSYNFFSIDRISDPKK